MRADWVCDICPERRMTQAEAVVHSTEWLHRVRLPSASRKAVASSRLAALRRAAAFWR